MAARGVSIEGVVLDRGGGERLTSSNDLLPIDGFELSATSVFCAVAYIC